MAGWFQKKRDALDALDERRKGRQAVVDAQAEQLRRKTDELKGVLEKVVKGAGDGSAVS